MTTQLEITYDPHDDAAYIYLDGYGEGSVADTIVLHDVAEPDDRLDGIHLDLDDDGRLVGIEIIPASRRLKPELLVGRPLPGDSTPPGDP